MNKLTKQDVIDAKIVVHGAGEYSPTTYAVSVIEQLEEYVSSLEQQLKTAKQEAVRIFANQQADLIANIDRVSARDAAAVEKCMPPVMQLTTVPVACREPMDFVIGFNRCRNEIKRNVTEQLHQQSANGE